MTMNKAEVRKMRTLTEENERLRAEMARQSEVIRNLIHEVTTYRIAVIRIHDEVEAVRKDRGWL